MANKLLLHQNFAQNIFVEFCMKEDPCARIKRELTRLRKYSFRIK
jgi:hypothetical protein